jgi:hypothetical protein
VVRDVGALGQLAAQLLQELLGAVETRDDQGHLRGVVAAGSMVLGGSGGRGAEHVGGSDGGIRAGEELASSGAWSNSRGRGCQGTRVVVEGCQASAVTSIGQQREQQAIQARGSGNDWGGVGVLLLGLNQALDEQLALGRAVHAQEPEAGAKMLLWLAQVGARMDALALGDQQAEEGGALVGLSHELGVESHQQMSLGVASIWLPEAGAAKVHGHGMETIGDAAVAGGTST